MKQTHRLRQLKCLAFVGLFTSSSVYADLNDGLVVYYPFNGNANDEQSGSNTFINLAPSIYYTDGIFGQGLASNGQNNADRINVLNPFAQDSFTISYWSKPLVDHNKNYGDSTISVWHPTNAMMRSFGFTMSSGNSKHYHQHEYPELVVSDHTNNTGLGSVFYAEKQLSEQQWHHILLTYSNGSIDVFIDGIPAIKNKVTLFSPVGRNLDITLRGSDLLDELRIYNRVLSPEEVTALYSGVIDDEICKHAGYSFKKTALTIPFIEMPIIDFLTGQPTGETELWKGKLKQVTGTVNRFKVLSPSITQITDDSTSSCPATYTVETGTLTIPYIDVPTGIEIGNKQQPGQDTEVFKATMIWDQIGKSFVVQKVKQVAD